MKHRTSILLLIFFMSLPWKPGAQRYYPKNQFRSPVDFPLMLAGGFGDPRKNHFHSGIDVRTEGQEGKPVHAIADGFVSRINISSGGYGKALYITHPNGFTSVYGHLKSFNPVIGTWIRDQQYKKETFELDAPVDPGVLKVKKGDIVAYSGNTGLSEGPHLHFEIRDAATQEAINPMLFGLPFKDGTPPKIYNIRIYPLDELSMVNFTGNKLTLPVNASGPDCRISLKDKDTVKVTGNIIFGIQAVDFSNDTGSRDGISSIELYVDTACYFSEKIERFAFAETRFVNSGLDFPQLIKNGQRIMRSYIAPNDKLSMYGKGKNRGIVNFNDTKAHKIVYVVKDPFGNTSRLTFWVKSHLPPGTRTGKEKTVNGTLLSCGKPNHFTAEGILFDLPSDALYEDLDFAYSSSAAVRGGIGRVYHLQNQFTPIHSAAVLALKADAVPTEWAEKALIVKVNEAGHFSSRGGDMKDGFLKTQIREFGDYTIAVDTVPPVIKAVNVGQNKNVSKQKNLSFTLSDDLAGIRSYRGTLNGKWILLDYNARSGHLFYSFDDRLRSGKNTFRLVVKDAVGNESIYQAAIIR